MKYYINLVVSLLFSAIIFAQTTYTIDYTNDYYDPNNCNVFGARDNFDNRIHQSIIGSPKFSTTYGNSIKLSCYKDGFNNAYGTGYQILFPFKKDYKYKVNIFCRGEVSNATEFLPFIGISLNQFKRNVQPYCKSPEKTFPIDYSVTTLSKNNYAWSGEIINTNPLPFDYESLSIVATPFQNSATNTQNIYVAKVVIIEIAPLPSGPSSPINGKFAKDDNTNKIYWGLEGNYRFLEYRTQYELFGSNYLTYVNNNLSHFTGIPTPIGEPIGWNINDDTYPNAFLIKNVTTNTLYYAEAKLIDSNDAYTEYYILRKVSDQVKNFYGLFGATYNRSVINFSATPSPGAYILGPDLTI